MNYNRPDSVNIGRLVAGIIMALLFGALTPVALVLEMTLLTPVIITGGLFLVFLYTFAGTLPAWLFLIVQLVSTAALVNNAFMWMLVLAGVIPACAVIRGIAMKQPFFTQLRNALIAYGAGLVAAVFLAYAIYGGNMIGKLADLMREQFTLMPDEVFSPIVDAINSAISPGGVAGFEPFTVESYRAQVAGVLELMSETYALTLPGTLISGALITGMLSVLWGNWIRARRGLATNESYIPLNRWFMPGQMSLGLTVMWLFSYILSQTQYASGQTVYIVVYHIASSAFAVQGIAAVDRFLYRRGSSAGSRRVLATLGFLLGVVFRLLNTVLFTIGAISALFGSHGAFHRSANDYGDQTDRDDP